MKLLLTAAVVFGLAASAACKTYFSQYRSGGPYEDETHVQGHGGYDRYGQHGGAYGLSSTTGDGYYGKQNGEYSESNWNVQSSYQPKQNKFGQYKQGKSQTGDEYAGEEGDSPSRRSQIGGGGGGGAYGQYRDSDERYYQQQQFPNKKHSGNGRYHDSFFEFSEPGSSAEFDSQEDYIKDEITNDISMDIGRMVAQKMVKFFAIFEKYAARDGAVQTSYAHDPYALRQWTFPMAHHEFLTINDTGMTGLSQGVINTMYVNTDLDTVDLEYFFGKLFAKGYMKSSTGPKGPFTLMMADAYVNVSTQLEAQNRNRNYAHSHSANVDIKYPGSGDSSDGQMINEYIETKYVPFVNKAIENEMIDYAYGGLVGCLRSEIESPFSMPSNNNKLNLVIENKKTQLTVSLTRTQAWNEDQASSKLRKIQSVAFRQYKPGKGYKLKVKTILAKQPTWESDVFAKKSHQEFVVKNVNFHAKYIVATVIMERAQLPGGGYKFNVEDASVKLEGLKYDIGKFDLDNTAYEMFARDIGHSLPKILENGMSAALQQQLYQQQQICQQSLMDCVRCDQQ